MNKILTRKLGRMNIKLRRVNIKFHIRSPDNAAMLNYISTEKKKKKKQHI